jgi:hypothetical protein
MKREKDGGNPLGEVKFHFFKNKENKRGCGLAYDEYGSTNKRLDVFYGRPRGRLGNSQKPSRTMQYSEHLSVVIKHAIKACTLLALLLIM